MWSRHFSKLIRKGRGRFLSTLLEGHYYWVWREWIPQRLGKSSGMLKPPSFSTRISKQNLPINLSTVNPLEPILCWGQSIHSLSSNSALPLPGMALTHRPFYFLTFWLPTGFVSLASVDTEILISKIFFYIFFLYAKQAPFHKS